jgi:hypothetical protein
LTLTELNYHPASPSATELAALPTVEKDDFEFIELTNISANSIDLAGVRFDQGITYVFNSDPLNTSILALDPGARCLLVRNKTAFELRYGTGLPIAGVYQGSLSNSGETIRAFDAAGSILAFFEYNDSGSWPGRPDGDGSSLEITRQSGLPDPAYDDSDAWRASVELHGSPARAGMEPRDNVVINEVLSHTDPPQSDSIELLNTSATQVGIAGWYLSDSSENLFKFAIPNGTLLDVGGYITYNESHFNPTPPIPVPMTSDSTALTATMSILWRPPNAAGGTLPTMWILAPRKTENLSAVGPTPPVNSIPCFTIPGTPPTPARVWDRSSSAKSITTPEPCPMRRNSNLSKSTIQPPWLWI